MYHPDVGPNPPPPPANTHTGTHAHTRANARTHARTHTPTTKNLPSLGWGSHRWHELKPKNEFWTTDDG